jgi:DNA repair protein RadC
MHGAKPLVNARQVYARLTSVRRARQEHFVIFCLNTRGGAIHRQLVSLGTLNATVVHPREVFYPAIVRNAASIILAHNHPSGDSSPSDEDIGVTQRLVEAGTILGIDVVDHVIVAERGYTSLRDKGLMQRPCNF